MRRFRRTAIQLIVGIVLGPGVLAGRGVAQASEPHLILISIDGLRPDAITARGAPTLHRLASEGSHSVRASTIYPSTTLPAHVSMLTGVPPDVHGVTWNADLVALDGYATFPTLFTEAESAGLNTAAFIAKSKLRFVFPPGSVDHLSVPSMAPGGEYGEETVGKAVVFLESNRPNLLLVHIGDPDYAGHLYGWMGVRYTEAVRAVDDQVAALLSAADDAFGAGSYTVIVTADHGGASHGHGGTDTLDLAIPWIIWGRGVSAGIDVDTVVRTIDTAPTALRILGLPAASWMRGRAVEAVLAPPA